jgi:hypothetical protein
MTLNITADYRLASCVIGLEPVDDFTHSFAHPSTADSGDIHYKEKFVYKYT